MQKCLDKDPAKRWSCEQLLQHPFFERFSFKKPDYGDLERIARVSTFGKRIALGTNVWLREFASGSKEARTEDLVESKFGPSLKVIKEPTLFGFHFN